MAPKSAKPPKNAMATSSKSLLSLPSPGQTALNAPPGKVCLYADFFRFSHFRLPVSKFCLQMLGRYGVHISQMSPLGLIRLYHYEFVLRSIQEDVTPLLFRVFFKLVKKDDWYSFDKRGGVIQWRSPLDPIVDPIPAESEYANSRLYKWLCKHPTDIQSIPEHALVATGISRFWDSPSTKPVYLNKDGTFPLQEGAQGRDLASSSSPQPSLSSFSQGSASSKPAEVPPGATSSLSPVTLIGGSSPSTPLASHMLSPYVDSNAINAPLVPGSAPKFIDIVSSSVGEPWASQGLSPTSTVSAALPLATSGSAMVHSDQAITSADLSRRCDVARITAQVQTTPVTRAAAGRMAKDGRKTLGRMRISRRLSPIRHLHSPVASHSRPRAKPFDFLLIRQCMLHSEVLGYTRPCSFGCYAIRPPSDIRPAIPTAIRHCCGRMSLSFGGQPLVPSWFMWPSMSKLLSWRSHHHKP
ncbi:hypothetical protein E3N88_41794 [Mikania micrantha]|uniref:Uncharacterized protein n=1 Tax=Mikania micrantha TaxID=192012 RepID=A0A5N6LJP0_9ASTR|nr:hypothetical protein E3N88_41794 [Mikania micrantha]